MIPKVRKVKKIIARNWLATPWKKEKKNRKKIITIIIIIIINKFKKIGNDTREKGEVTIALNTSSRHAHNRNALSAGQIQVLHCASS